MSDRELDPPIPAILGDHWRALILSLEDLDLGIAVVLDEDGQLTRLYTNRAAARIYGYSFEEAQSLPVMVMVPEEERAKLLTVRNAILSGAPLPPVIETVFQQPDGGRIPVELRLSRRASGRGHLVLTLIRDLRGDRRAQRKLLEASRMALVGAIAASAAHEINNPLTYVLLHLRSLRRDLPSWHLADPVSDNIARLLDEAEQGAVRVRGTVRDLLALYHDAERHDAVDIARVVEGAIRLIRPALETRAHIECDLGPVAPIAGDETRLSHAVIAMLLFAAAGFTKEAPDTQCIQIRVGDTGESVYVEVRDNGSSLPAEELPRAFDPLFVGRGTTVGGSLAVLWEIANALGGEARAATLNSGGICTTLLLPARV